MRSTLAVERERLESRQSEPSVGRLRYPCLDLSIARPLVGGAVVSVLCTTWCGGQVEAAARSAKYNSYEVVYATVYALVTPSTRFFPLLICDSERTDKNPVHTRVFSVRFDASELLEACRGEGEAPSTAGDGSCMRVHSPAIPD
ncbi:uncharacterized protein P884DRAFT_271250 [Thermothelomyces heterothallicus CBS 202.75]|uniref:uncharacterized protein n=1 Tax=Thermothelomyces heterothallicus CBS 202.75 TaxID=1149848 RepID=UPI003743251D